VAASHGLHWAVDTVSGGAAVSIRAARRGCVAWLTLAVDTVRRWRSSYRLRTRRGCVAWALHWPLIQSAVGAAVSIRAARRGCVAWLALTTTTQAGTEGASSFHPHSGGRSWIAKAACTWPLTQFFTLAACYLRNTMCRQASRHTLTFTVARLRKGIFVSIRTRDVSRTIAVVGTKSCLQRC